MDPHLTWLLTHIHKFSLSTCKWRKWVVSCQFQRCRLAEWSLQLFIVPQLLLLCWDTHRNRHTPPETLGFCLSLTSSFHFNTCDCCPVVYVISFSLPERWAYFYHRLQKYTSPTSQPVNWFIWFLDTEYWWCARLLSVRVNTFCVECWSPGVHLRNLHSPCDKWHIVIDFKKINRQISVNLYSCQIKIDH